MVDVRPLSQLRSAVVATLLLTILCGVAFPAAIWGVAQLFPDRAHGSLVVVDGTARGSRLIGQAFHSPIYFHGRPSAAGDGYDATSSGGTNLALDNPKQVAAVAEHATAYRTINQLSSTDAVPADAITASASGLDPHISPDNAAAQASRVAHARGISLARVQALIERHTEGRTVGVIGEPRVNVFELNLALDAESPRVAP